jgi:hypothetical protein
VDVKEIGRDDTDWIQLTQDKVMRMALADTVMNFQIPEKAGN